MPHDASSSPTGKNALKLLLFTVLLGAFAGLVIWCFLKAVAFGTELVWQVVPKRTGSRALTVFLPAAGGLLVGILHKYYGNYPDELTVVMEKVKKEKHYDYHPMFIILVCAFLPLVFGSSVGPEAGLTGIIAALCYWVGDNVSFAKQNTAVLSQAGEALTLGQLFHSPLFGILAVEEESQEAQSAALPLSKSWKLVLYGLSTAASFLVIGICNHLFGKAMSGFPSFSEVPISRLDYVLLLVYIPVGIVLYLLFEKCEQLTGMAAARLPVILRETLCGAVIGLMGLVLPIVLFSGEEQMHGLMEDPGAYTPWFLLIVCLVKIIMTAFCLNFGMKGGHFFPLIFACTCMGYALTMLFFADSISHAAFAAGIVTAAVLGAQLKKPLAASVLLLLCFPVRFLFWLFLSAALGSFLSQQLEKRRHDKNQPAEK